MKIIKNEFSVNTINMIEKGLQKINAIFNSIKIVFSKITSNVDTNYSKSYNQDCEFKLKIFKIVEILFIDFLHCLSR